MSPNLGRAAILVVASILSSVSAFSFSYSAPTQCGPLSVSWSGGTAPFSLLITPAFGTPTNLSIPSSAITNGKGNYTTQLTLPTGRQFLLTMSDATGFGTGGTSGALSAAGPLNGASCNTTIPAPPFTFQLNNALQQCLPYPIDGFNGTTSAVTIYGLIPLGTPFELPVPAGQTAYTWPAVDVAAGTSIIFTLFDASGNTGGSSDLLTVQNSNSNTCLSSDSPHSTVTGSPTSTSSASSSPTSSQSSGSSNTGAIVGGSIAGVVLLAGLIGGLVFYFCFYKRKDRKRARSSAQWQKRQTIDIEPDEGPSTTHRLDGAGNYEPEPYMLPASADRPNSGVASSDSGTYPPGHPGAAWRGSQNTHTDEQGRGGGPAASTSGRTSKYSEAFSSGRQPNTPARFVLHTDGGEVPNEAEEEVVELPPQYSSITGGANVARAPTYRERDRNAAASASSSPGETAAQGEPSTGPSST